MSAHSGFNSRTIVTALRLSSIGAPQAVRLVRERGIQAGMGESPTKSGHDGGHGETVPGYKTRRREVQANQTGPRAVSRSGWGGRRAGHPNPNGKRPDIPQFFALLVYWCIFMVAECRTRPPRRP